MKKEEALELREVTSNTIHDLISVTLDFERELIHIEMFGKIIELPIVELNLHKNSCRDFIKYIKERLGVQR